MITLVKRFAILLLIQVTVFSHVHADNEQELKTFYNSFLPNFQKLTPEASALGQYGKYGVSGYTGVPNISVPLFTIGSGNFSMPIELSYDASGIKVEQEATYVGLGWNLIMGGCINHIICGQNDFRENVITTEGQISNIELLRNVLPDVQFSLYPTAGFPSVELEGTSNYDIQNVTILPIKAHRKKQTILKNVINGAKVPDIFQASFCGHSVSFIIDTSDKKARIIGNDATNYKIELKEYSSYYPRTIEITDDHGLTFVFSLFQETDPEDNSTYNLSKIKNLTECLVEFKYSQKEGYNLKSSYYETMGKRDETYNRPIGSTLLQRQFIDRNYPNTIFHGINKFYPDSIITKREIITFTYGNRTDIRNAKRIDEISVKSINNNSIIHTVNFSYGDFKEGNIDTELCNRYGYSGAYGLTRLKLTKVTVDGKNYSFEYIDDDKLPTRLSKNQDFWGYYNGMDGQNNDGFCASPKYKINKGVVSEIDFVGPANRYASPNDCKVGTLKKITHPTGGYSVFDYEINHFDDSNSFYYPSSYSYSSRNPMSTEKYSVGCDANGTMEKTFHLDETKEISLDWGIASPNSKTTTTVYIIDVKSGKEYVKEYVISDKKQGVKKISLPGGDYKIIAEITGYSGSRNGSVYANIKIEYAKGTKNSISPDTSIEDASGKSIGAGLRIKTIKNYDNDNQLLDYTQYKYEGGKLLIPSVKGELVSMQYSNAEQIDHDKVNNPWAGMPWTINYIYSPYDCRFFFISSSPTYPEICSLGSPTIGYSKVTKEHYDKNKKLLSYDIETYNNKGYVELGNESMYFNMFYVNIDGLNGKMIGSSTYSKDSVLMHNIIYSYNSFGQTPSSADKIVYFPWARSLTMQSALYGRENYKYSLYTKYPINALPERVTETNYVNGVAMKPVTTTFEYNASNYQQAKVTKTVELNSKTKDVVTTQYWYPNDSEVSNSNPSYLTKVNCISEVVKAKTFKNGNIVGGYRNFYGALSNNLPVVKKNYSIDTSNSENLELDVINYDNYGNIREYKKKDGTPVTVIWAYNHQFPVMEIVGQTYSQVKTIYTSLTYLEEKYTTSEEIEKSIEALHKALLNKKIMATAYEYSPWHTVKRIIKPNGYIVNYGYDSFGRLAETKDASGILQKYSYNYKNK